MMENERKESIKLDKKKILISSIVTTLMVILMLTGKLSVVLSFFGYYGVNFPPAYRYNIFLMIGMTSIFFFMTYTIYEICQITFEKLRKRENINLENFVKYLLAGYIFFIAIPQSRKYGLRVMGYIIFPYIVYNIIKNRKKIKYDINDIFLGGFWLSILASIRNSLDRKNVLDEFQDGTFIFFIPLIMKQMSLGAIFEKIMIRFSLLAFSIKIILGYLEKINVIYGIHTPRIGGGDSVWTYAGLLMLGIVPLIYILINKKNLKIKEKIYISYGLYLSMIPMLWSQNRANWVAIGGVTALMLISKNFKKGIIVVSLTLALILGAVYSGKVNNPFIKRVETILKYDKDGSAQARFEVWRGSVRMFKKFPITGVGYSFDSFAEREEYEKEGYRNRKFSHSHNSYLYILATTGILGIIFFAAFNIRLLYTLFKNRNFLSHLAMYILLSWQLMGLFETPIRYLNMTGVLLFLIGYAQNKNLQEKKHEQ